MESSNRMSISSTTFSLSLMQLPAISRLRSSFLKKLPEPLRRAVADCLSSPLTSALEPSRTLRVRPSFFFFSLPLPCNSYYVCSATRVRDDNFSVKRYRLFLLVQCSDLELVSTLDTCFSTLISERFLVWFFNFLKI